MSEITAEQWGRINDALKDRPQCHLVYSEDEEGSGYTIQTDNGSLIHPLSFLDIIENTPNEVIDILKHDTPQHLWSPARREMEAQRQAAEQAIRKRAVPEGK